jgi:hypothetical protein
MPSAGAEILKNGYRGVFVSSGGGGQCSIPERALKILKDSK